ncbi:MAG: deoxyribonuclease IV [Anaerolineales bacterium]
MPRLGAHMSIAGGPANALYRGASIACDAIQMFVGSPNRWRSKPFTESELDAFAQAVTLTNIAPIVAHSAYLINLGSPDDALFARSRALLIDELERCAALHIGDYVLHPGAHMGAGEEAGLARIAQGLSEALAATASGAVRILLETTAGMGTQLGSRFEHLAWLIDHLGGSARVGVCLDTAHVLAAGYDLRTPQAYAALWATFADIIGLDRLHCLHLNDSQKPLGSRVDRHTWIGQGQIGVGAFALLVNDPQLREVPMLLETPKGEDLREDVEALTLLRSLIHGQDANATEEG